MAGRAYLVVGPPLAGKSTLLRLVRENRIPGLTSGMILTKETTRRRRADEGTEILPVQTITTARLPRSEELVLFALTHSFAYAWDDSASALTVRGPVPFGELQQLLSLVGNNRDGIYALTQLYRRANVISARCDVIYEQYTYRYGFATQDVIRALASGRSIMGIVNDIRAVREVRSLLGPLAVVLFLYRGVKDDFTAMQTSRGAVGSDGAVDLRQAERRRRKAEVILRRYIDNIELFDHVILNTLHEADAFEADLAAQLAAIVARYQQLDARTFHAHEGLYE